MSSTCDSLKSMVMWGWVSAEPSRAGCGVVASEPSGCTRRLSFSIPRRRLFSTSRGSALRRSSRGKTSSDSTFTPVGPISSAQATQYFQRSQAQQLHLVGDLHHRLVVRPETLDIVPPSAPQALRLRRSRGGQDLREIANIDHAPPSLHRIAELAVFLEVQVFHDDLRLAQILERLERGDAHAVIDFGLLVAPGVIRHSRKRDDDAEDGHDVGTNLRHDLRAVDYDLHLTAYTCFTARHCRRKHGKGRSWSPSCVRVPMPDVRYARGCDIQK